MRNDLLLNSHVNKTFEEVLWMDMTEFRQWVKDLRETVVDLWDNHGLPPRVGFSEEETIEQFNNMIGFPVHKFETTDLLTNEKNVVRNTSVIGNAVNEWFPTMMKTGISYTSKGKARSIYDYFADESLYETFVVYASRHFKRDSFYHYSVPVSYGDKNVLGTNYNIADFKSFVQDKPNIEYFLCPVKENKEYTGYNTVLKKKQNIIVTMDEIEALIDDIPERSRTNVDYTKTKHYSVRVFKTGQRLFPVGLKAFRVSFCQYAVNFPPLTARYLYEKFTDHIASQDKINIYDPSAGWGGRLIGALSVNDSRNIHYIGTDPNTDHNVGNGRTKYHEVADFFNDHVRHNKLFVSPHTYEIFQDGSEVINVNPKFQIYHGQLDLIFTSPPYFNKEVYSDDAAQSCHKFTSYEAWRDGFLMPTLSTCYNYLRKDRYLLWNIADIALDGKLLPLEADSRSILEDLGMKYKGVIKMALSQMPGGNRTSETGEVEEIETDTVFGVETETVPVIEGKMKNFCMIRSKGKTLMLKYEPIFVFYKP